MSEPRITAAQLRLLADGDYERDWRGTFRDAADTIDSLTATLAPVTRVNAILADMRTCSEAVDEAYGTSDYQTRLIALALVARHFLREWDG